MWWLLIGIAIGCLLGLFVNKQQHNNSNKKVQTELDELLVENEKLRQKNKESERLVEDLQSQLSLLKKQQKSKEDMHNDLIDELEVLITDLQNKEKIELYNTNKDLIDELDAERRKNKRLSNQIVELTAQLDDYKTALQSLEIENKQLKNN